MRLLGALEPPPERVQLAAGQVQAKGPQLGDEPVVAAGRLGLALEGPELAAHLPLQVLEPEQVLLARLEPPLRTLAAPAELEHARGFLDHHAPVLGAGLRARSRAGPG